MHPESHRHGHAIAAMVKELAQRRRSSCAPSLSAVQIVEQRVPFCTPPLMLGYRASRNRRLRDGQVTDSKRGAEVDPRGGWAFHEWDVISQQQIVEGQPEETN